MKKHFDHALLLEQQGQIAEVEAYAAETRIESWHDGEVTQILLQSCELVPPGFPVVTVMDMNDAWAVFHIREGRLAEFPKGHEFVVTIPALNNSRHPFRVNHVAVMGDFVTWRTTNGDKGFDMRSFEVEAKPALFWLHGLLFLWFMYIRQGWPMHGS